MNMVRVKNRPAQHTGFNNLLDTFFAPLPSFYRDDFNVSTSKQPVPVNVIEKEAGYDLEVVAPGFEKDDFKIRFDGHTLTIAVEKEAAEGPQEKRIRHEYRFASFKRSFNVDETIDTAAISAKYVNGVLTLNLPKKANVKEAAKQIEIQ